NCMLRNKLLWTIVVCIAFPFVSLAQVTTSNLGGSVIGNTGDPLLGATIKVTHEPTGTVYKAQSRTGGRFDIANLNPGGPYTIEVSYLNYA
ncbi:carboxypeptidase-like regulatory domain-containing protein, partial [Acinetobacter baumannii]